MIKTKDGKTTAAGTKADLLIDFTGTAESLMRRTLITAEELHKAVKLAEMTIEFIEVLDKAGAEIDERSTVILEEEEPEAEDEPAEPAQAEEKEPAKEGKLRVGKFEGDDIDGMLEWLKGELENLEEELDD